MPCKCRLRWLEDRSCQACLLCNQHCCPASQDLFWKDDGWARVAEGENWLWLCGGFFFKPRHSDRRCMDGTFCPWPTCPNSPLRSVKCCFPRKVSCELAYFKKLQPVRREGVLWQHYIIEASRCWVIIIFRQLHAGFGCSKNSPCVWTLQKVTSIKTLSPLRSWNAFFVSRFGAHFLEFYPQAFCLFRLCVDNRMTLSGALTWICSAPCEMHSLL